MPTVYSSITAYCEKNKVKMPSLEARQEIGKEVVKAWFLKKNKCNQFIALHKVKIKEHDADTEVQVLSYPRIFLPVIDSIISDFFKKKGLNRTTPRKRIPAKNSINNNFLKRKF